MKQSVVGESQYSKDGFLTQLIEITQRAIST